MQISATPEVAKRRRRRSASAPAAPMPDRILPSKSPAHTWRTFEVPSPSRAGGEWTVDWERAHADAQQVLDAIDFSKRDIVIWAPGTSNSGPHKDFEAAVRDSYAGEGTNLVALQYEASWHLRRSLPTGIATLRLVLEGIRARGGDHRVLLAGESQGAWIIGEAIADPAVSNVVDRAILMGHPWLAKHQYAEGQDPRVRVINHDGDQITMTVRGDAGVGMDAMAAVKTGKLGAQLGTVAKAILANPLHGVLLLHTMTRDSLPWMRPYLRDPHLYGGEMSRMVDYLRTGALDLTDEEVDDRKHGRRT